MTGVPFNHAKALGRVRKPQPKFNPIMKPNDKRISVVFAAMAFTLIGLAVSLQAAALSDQEKQFLSAYSKAHDALAADDLDGVKKAAGDLGSDGAELAKSTSLKDARTAFEKLSVKAKQLTAGQSGYYVYHCPMLNKDWVQTSTTIANPYSGKGMMSCGEIRK